MGKGRNQKQMEEAGYKEGGDWNRSSEKAGTSVRTATEGQGEQFQSPET